MLPVVNPLKCFLRINSLAKHFDDEKLLQYIIYLSMSFHIYACIYVCISVCMYVYMYICIRLSPTVLIYLSIYLSRFIYIHVCTYVCLSVRTYVRTYICMCLLPSVLYLSIYLSIYQSIFTNPSARAGYDTRSIFKLSLTGLNSEFSFS